MLSVVLVADHSTHLTLIYAAVYTVLQKPLREVFGGVNERKNAHVEASQANLDTAPNLPFNLGLHPFARYTMSCSRQAT